MDKLGNECTGDFNRNSEIKTECDFNVANIEQCQERESYSQKTGNLCQSDPKRFGNYLVKVNSLEIVQTKSAGKIQCSICAATYNNTLDYTHHLNVHLKNDEKETPKQQLQIQKYQIHTCHACDKIFLEKRLLENHIKTHAGHSSNQSIMSRGVQPKLNQGVQPKLNQYVQPKLNQAVQPKLNQAVQPKLNQGVQPKLNQGVQPKLIKAVRTKVHLQRYDRPKLLKCRLCDLVFTDSRFLEKHIQTCHAGNYQIKVIKTTCVTATPLISNTQSDRSTPHQVKEKPKIHKIHKCIFCKTLFKDSMLFMKHLENHGLKEIKVLQPDNDNTAT